MTELYKKNGAVFVPVGITLEEVEKLIEKIEAGYDVVYASYENKQHSGFRNWGSAVNSKMTALANAIRTKSGVTGLLGLDAMTSAVLSIEKKTETTKSITPTLTDQTVTPNEGEVFSEVTVAGVTKELVASLDSNFINSNILPDVSILGLQGTADIMVNKLLNKDQVINERYEIIKA